MTTRSILQSVFVVFIVLGSSMALDCYFCQDDDCADPFNTTNAMTMSCPFNDSMCVTMEFEGNFTRSCVPSDACSTTGCYPGFCVSCCDDEDLCNGRPLIPTNSSVNNCYGCSYRSDTGVDAACIADPFDPTGAGVYQFPCDGACTVSTRDDNGVTEVIRSCLPAGYPCGEYQCFPAPINACLSCCEGNLCNTGAPPSFQQPSTPVTPLLSSPAEPTADTAPTGAPRGSTVMTTPDVGLPGSPTSEGPTFAPIQPLMTLVIAIALYLTVACSY